MKADPGLGSLIWVGVGVSTFVLGVAQPEKFIPVHWDATVKLPIEVRGEKRQYHLLLPKSGANQSDDKGERVPAIVMLHGNGNNASVFAASQTLTAVGLRSGFAMIFPDGIADPSSPLPCRGRSWNAGTCCGPALIFNVDDVGFLREVVNDATKRFELNQHHVFLSGASNGGSMALRAACELGGDVFAGVAADVASLENRRGERCATHCLSNASGDGYVYCAWDTQREGCRESDWLTLPRVFDCQNSRSLPTLLFNGNFDPFSSPQLPREPNNTGMVSYPIDPSVPWAYNTSFPPLEYAVRLFAKRNGCTDPTHLSFRNGTDGNSTVCRTWVGCDANVTFCLSDAGHTWFGDFFSAEYSHGLCEFENGGPPNDASCYPTRDSPPPIYNTYSVNESAQTLAFFKRIQGT